MTFYETDQRIAEDIRDRIKADQPGGRIEAVSDNGATTAIISAVKNNPGLFVIKVETDGAGFESYNDLVHLESILRGTFNFGIVILPAGTCTSKAGRFCRKYIAADYRNLETITNDRQREQLVTRQPKYAWLSRVEAATPAEMSVKESTPGDADDQPAPDSW